MATVGFKGLTDHLADTNRAMNITRNKNHTNPQQTDKITTNSCTK